MFEPDGSLLTGLMAVGMAWAFVRADARSATSRALAVALALAGLAIFARSYLVGMQAQGPLPGWAGLLVLPGSGAFIAAFEWTARLRKTIPSGALRTRFGDKATRVAQGLVVLYAGAALARPTLWAEGFLSGLEGRAPWSLDVVLSFALPLGLALLLWTFAMLLCLNRRPEPAERVRLTAMLVAVPMMSAGLVVPLNVTPLMTTLALVVLLGGAMRHAELHGRKGLFMSRFLSPQVATLVNDAGLQAAMQENCHEISVVCCDLRGFTAYAAASDSQAVLALLREYYDAVGEEVQRIEGTVKDYAGDGVLILVGAPVPLPDHATRAVTLAERLARRLRPLVRAAGRPDQPLGVGIGVASG
ncbi:MAG: adenylate/guanylate cyclase domain-containing protein, partial [Gammaproteobacteria bacterium]